MKILVAVFLALSLAAGVYMTIPAQVEEPQIAMEFHFSTTDREGNPVTEAVLAEHTVTILNFWEPWCQPCIREMPDLERISQEYADRGVLVLGIYATPGVEEDVDDVIASTGVTYQMLHYSHDFDGFQTGYVPTTVILDSTGHVVQQPLSQSLLYSQWVSLLERVL